jgi:hypothetical protein
MLALSGLAALCIPAASFPLLPHVIAASVMFVVLLTFILSAAVMGMTLFTIVVPDELRGLCMALLVAINILVAMGASPLAVSLLSDAMGGTAKIGEALMIVSIATCLGAAFTFASGRKSI